MNERDESTTTTLELLLSEPEVVAWLSDYRPVPEEAPDDDEQAAA
jgi:IS1 family transposase